MFITINWLLLLTLATGAFAEEYCKQLNDRHANENWTHSKVFYRNKRNTISVLHARSSPARAAAELFAVTLRHGPALRYDVNVAPGAADLCQYMRDYKQTDDNFTDLVIDLSVKWNPDKKCPSNCNDNFLTGTSACWLGGNRLQLVPRVGVTHSRVMGLLYLPPPLRNDSICLTADNIYFFLNKTAIRHCGFITTDDFDEYNATAHGASLLQIDKCHNKTCALVFIPSDWTEEAESWARIFNGHNVHLLVQPLESDKYARRLLIDKFEKANRSFLFIDHKEWMSKGVRPFLVESPNNKDGTSDDNVSSLRLADVQRLKMTAPRVYETLLNFTVFPDDLREVLEEEVRLNNVTEAACSWAYRNTKAFETWMPTYNLKTYIIYIALCIDDPDLMIYDETINTIEKHIVVYTKWALYEYKRLYIKCSDKLDLKAKFLRPTITLPLMRIAGLIAAGAGVPYVLFEDCKPLDIPMLTYDVPSYCYSDPSSNTRNESCLKIPSISGDVNDLAYAFHLLFSEYNWKRIAILSEKTNIAEAFRKALLNGTDPILLQNIEITKDTIENKINELKSLDARVIVINTGASLAGLVACKAVQAGLGDATHAWVAREWRSYASACGALEVLFSVSPAWRSENVTGGSVSLRADLAKNATNVPLLAPFADALITLAVATDRVLVKHGDQRDNLRSRYWTELLSKEVMSWDVEGAVQPLRSSSDSIFTFVRKRPLFFVHKWNETKPSLLRILCVENRRLYSNCSTKLNAWNLTITDGTKLCVTTTSGNQFSPECFDGAWFGGATVTILAFVALVMARRWRLRLLKQRDDEIKVRLTRCELVLRATRARLVSWDRLELLEQLGAGHFGRVRLALLHEPGLPPVELAAKELAMDASAGCEQEFLREASLVARLDHAHIVRLIGVCVDGEVPLLLMERAFFGDLSRYLRARRHLATKRGGEAEQVSAVALTRLGREAAAALEYLVAMRVVHRDLRAANCLVDERRTLVVADFGMARQIGEDYDDQYECTRRALFPVRWMAPESLEIGVFSHASDMWAFGVLLLELITLGEQPYGGWSLQAVVTYVREGGHPTLPPDASMLTRNLLGSCWRREPRQRARAAAVHAFLEANPRALAPVVAAADNATPGGAAPITAATSLLADVALADSGFSETLLEPCNRFVDTTQV